MRLARLAFILLAFYFLLLGGSAYYYQFYAFRVLHHVVASVVLIGWLAWRVRFGLPTTPITLPIFAVIAVWLASALFSDAPRSALENIWFPLTHVVIFFVLADMLRRGREKWLFETLFLLAGVVTMVALAQWASWYIGLGVTPDTRMGWLSLGIVLPPESPMLYLPVGVSTWLAAWAAPLIVVVAVWARTAFRRSYRRPLWLLAFGLLLVLLGTNSRGGLIALAASVGGLLALGALDALRKRLDRRVLLLALGGAAGLAAVVLAAVLLIGRSEARWSGDMLRVNLWRGATTLIAEHPLFGVGVGMFGRAYREVRDPTLVDNRFSTAHNAYLNGAAETGLIGAAAGALLALTLAWAWWRARSAAVGDRRLRLDACMAALVGFGAQSLFDSFTTTTLVAPTLLLAAYCVVPPGSVLNTTRSPRGRLPAALLMGGLAAYALAFVPLDLAHSQHNRSLRLPLPESLAAAQAAQNLDPALNLYALQTSYVTAQSALDAGDLDAAAAAYERALALEPTWDTGWINLAGVLERAGRIDEALRALERARSIDYGNAAALNWARIADEHNAADDEQIIGMYWESLRGDPMPTSAFWSATPRRMEMIRRYVLFEPGRSDLRYRSAAALLPDLRAEVVPESPASGYDWWTAAEHALTVEGDPARAVEGFTTAIRLIDFEGDFYVARARAYAALGDSAAAARDLAVADLLYVFYERPNAVRLTLNRDTAQVMALRIAALPPRVQEQNFEGVLYQGRVAAFDLLPQMRYPGPGRAILSPWYDLAADELAAGRTEAAINAYRVILDYAPAQTEARERLLELTGVVP
jgi:O-antigen ligase